MMKPEPKPAKQVEAQAEPKKGCGCGGRTARLKQKVDEMPLDQRRAIIAQRIAKRAKGIHPEKQKRIFL